MSQDKKGVGKESLLKWVETKPELMAHLLKFAEAISKISEARGTLDDRGGGCSNRSGH